MSTDKGSENALHQFGDSFPERLMRPGFEVFTVDIARFHDRRSIEKLAPVFLSNCPVVKRQFLRFPIPPLEHLCILGEPPKRRWCKDQYSGWPGFFQVRLIIPRTNTIIEV